MILLPEMRCWAPGLKLPSAPRMVRQSAYVRTSIDQLSRASVPLGWIRKTSEDSGAGSRLLESSIHRLVTIRIHSTRLITCPFEWPPLRWATRRHRSRPGHLPTSHSWPCPTTRQCPTSPRQRSLDDLRQSYPPRYKILHKE